MSEHAIHVFIQQARYVPKICHDTSQGEIVNHANSFVSFDWFHQHVSTRVIFGSSAPTWHHSSRLHLPTHCSTLVHGFQPAKHPLKSSLEMKLYHKAVEVNTDRGGAITTDLLIGSAEVPLSIAVNHATHHLPLDCNVPWPRAHGTTLDRTG